MSANENSADVSDLVDRELVLTLETKFNWVRMEDWSVIIRNIQI